jgi:hypothetical protein
VGNGHGGLLLERPPRMAQRIPFTERAFRPTKNRKKMRVCQIVIATERKGRNRAVVRGYRVAIPPVNGFQLFSSITAP